MLLEAAVERCVPWLSWLVAIVAAALPLALCLAWVEFKYPGLAALQFREHVGRVPKVLNGRNNWALPVLAGGRLFLRDDEKVVCVAMGND